MGQTLTEIAQTLKESNKKVQLIYAFNGVGKTRLSVEFKNLVYPKTDCDNEENSNSLKVLYYNAFTEDLFYWDNDLEHDQNRVLKIQPNSFTYWLLNEEGKENEVSECFTRYVNTKTTPNFIEDFSQVTFSTKNENGDIIQNIKISKGEESCFIWSVFYTMLTLVLSELSESEENRSSDKFNNLKYIFIDDPVTSLDENHLIKLAVDLSALIRKHSKSFRFVITTHNPLFFNVLCNELRKLNKPKSNKGNNEDKEKTEVFKKFILRKEEDNTYHLESQPNDSPFSYHLFLLSEIKKAIDSNSLQKYHFNMVRNILEKTSTFLGITDWGDLLNGEAEKNYLARIVNISSHSKFSSMESINITDEDRDVLKNIMKIMTEKYHFRIQ